MGKEHVRPFVTRLKQRLKDKTWRIQVILGPRQIGKTTGILQLLQQTRTPNHYASADDELNPSAEWVLEQWQIAQQLNPKTLLVLDEIQKVPEWSSIIKQLWDKQNRTKKTALRPILLGSSSLQLQKGLSEALTGRFEVIHVPHWNYHETQAIHSMSLDDYLCYGGYPGSYTYLKDKQRWRQYIKESIVETVISRDILQLAQVKKPALFRQAFEILCSYPAQEVSYNKLLGQLQDKGNTDLIKYYIELYEGAFLFKTLQKYSEKAVLTKSSSPKIIPLCPALIQLNREDTASNEQKGRLFEVAIAMELNNLPGKLYYWRQGKYEVDFVYKNGSRLYAIEVKFGRKRNPVGLKQFCKQFTHAEPVILSPEQFNAFSKNAARYLEQI